MEQEATDDLARIRALPPEERAAALEALADRLEEELEGADPAADSGEGAARGPD